MIILLYDMRLKFCLRFHQDILRVLLNLCFCVITSCRAIKKFLLATEILNNIILPYFSNENTVQYSLYQHCIKIFAQYLLLFICCLLVLINNTITEQYLFIFKISSQNVNVKCVSYLLSFNITNILSQYKIDISPRYWKTF